MMLIGVVAKQQGPFWSADADMIGAHTQGMSRKEAVEALVANIDLLVESPGFKAAADDAGPGEVYITANEPWLLAARVLRYQRERHKLTLADVAKKLGASSINAYAAYEQGKREPSFSKYLEFLRVVAPEMALTVGPRKGPTPASAPVGVYMNGKKTVSRAADRARRPAPLAAPSSKGASKL